MRYCVNGAVVFVIALCRMVWKVRYGVMYSAFAPPLHIVLNLWWIYEEFCVI